MKDKKDNISKCTSSVPATQLITPENSSNNVNAEAFGNIRFKFKKDAALSQPFSNSLLLSINEKFFLKFKDKKQYIIPLPKFINEKDFNDFLFVTKNGIGEFEDVSQSNFKRIYDILRISEFFENERLSMELLNLIITNYKGFPLEEHLFPFLDLSYKKLSYCANKGIECESSWFEIFYFCLENIGKNLTLVINNYEIIKRKFNKITIEEIINKLFENLIAGNYILLQGESTISEPQVSLKSESEHAENNPNKKTNFISMASLDRILKILGDLKGNRNFFNLLSNEYLSLSSTATLNELSNTPVPTLTLNLPNSSTKPFYEEYPTDLHLNMRQVYFLIFYKDNTLNINIKLKNEPRDENFCFKIFTILTHIKINQEDEIIKMNSVYSNINYLSNNHNSLTIFTLKNYNRVITEIKTNLVVKIYLRICNVHSVLSSFLLKNFSSFSNDPLIYKTPKKLFFMIIKNKYIAKKSENEIITSLILWLQDPLNIKEDITEILNKIQWDKVKLELVFEFLIKFNSIFPNKEIPNQILYNLKFCELKEMFKMIFNVSEKVNYSKLMNEIKEKSIKSYIENIENLKCKNLSVEKSSVAIDRSPKSTIDKKNLTLGSNKVRTNYLKRFIKRENSNPNIKKKHTPKKIHRIESKKTGDKENNYFTLNKNNSFLVTKSKKRKDKMQK